LVAGTKHGQDCVLIKTLDARSAAPSTRMGEGASLAFGFLLLYFGRVTVVISIKQSSNEATRENSEDPTTGC